MKELLKNVNENTRPFQKKKLEWKTLLNGLYTGRRKTMKSFKLVLRH
jgi:hypothetical protein